MGQESDALAVLARRALVCILGVEKLFTECNALMPFEDF